MYTLLAYLVYLLLSIFTVFIVGKSLRTEGMVYLFGECQDKELSASANNFLYVCYCLLNTAFALFFLGTGKPMKSLAEALEFITYSQGFIFLCLGGLHFLNILVAPKIIQRMLQKKLLTNKT